MSERLNRATRRRYERRAGVFKALGHPTRLFLVEQLARGERCVCELAALIDADLSTVSKHLSVLKSAGVVEDEKRGANVFYRLRLGVDSLLAFAAEATRLEGNGEESPARAPGTQGRG